MLRAQQCHSSVPAWHWAFADTPGMVGEVERLSGTGGGGPGGEVPARAPSEARHVMEMAVQPRPPRQRPYLIRLAGGEQIWLEA